ncbi:MFS transporter [Alicyclobacillus mengziensis]|uniref:MFS transporter n=1 Tax=Alicyclobacillus mengziensis TaxID=2931921 RepID=A0A9X7Z917_9BACL|nr:MFS transporter [Alicyclobacillus mengziensis]QSO49053.1 MFS transporter [Alicyclobacillus mengziensis]
MSKLYNYPLHVVRYWNSIRNNNESLSIWNGSFSITSFSIVNGYVAMYLLDGLQATNSEMGLLNSLPSLVNLFAMLAAAFAIGRAKSKRVFCATATTISRSIYVLIAILPWLPIHNPAIWVVWLVALIRVPQSFGDLSWQALISDLIAPERRSVFFSERNRVTTIVGLLATLATGLLLQQFDNHLRWPYQVVFLTTVVFAAAEVWFLILHNEPAPVAKPTIPLLVKGIRRIRADTLKSVLKNRSFLIVIGGLLFFNFGWQVSWPLFNIYQISTAHAPALWLGLFTVANQLVQILTFRWWGRTADRFGNGRMMAVAAVGMALSPFLTILSTNMWYLFLINFVTGIPAAGTTLLLFNYLLEVCPEGERTTYIAYYNVVLSVVGFAAPEAGIWLLSHWGMNAGMLISTGLRLAAGVVFWVTSTLVTKRSQWSTSSSIQI